MLTLVRTLEGADLFTVDGKIIRELHIMALYFFTLRFFASFIGWYLKFG